MIQGHQLGLRLFLEGIEVPVIGAVVAIMPDSPAVAQIQVIAADKLLEIYPRTVVHLFFYDYADASSALSLAQLAGEELSEHDQELSKYKLLFMGEVHSITFQKGPGSRAAILGCVDFSNYWDTTYQYNFQGQIFGHRVANFIGANTNLLTSPLRHGVGTISSLLRRRSVNFPDLKGLLGGIVRCLEAIGGCYYGKTRFKGVTDFASIAELRLKILQQICAAEADDSTAKLFSRKTFNMWLNRQMQALDKLVTFRGVVNILNRFIFHQIFPNPCARYIPDRTELQTRVSRINLLSDPRYRTIVDLYREYIRIYRTTIDNFREATSSSFQEAKAILAVAGNRASDADAIYYTLLPKDAVSAQLKAVDIRAQLEELKKVLGGSHITDPMSIEVAADAARREKAIALLQTYIRQLEAALKGKIVKKKRQTTVTHKARLNNQILRPDIWFSAPPRCNVLFPEMCSDLRWSRNFMQEVTRLELQTTHEILGDSILLNGRYYAPNIKDMRRGIKLSARKFARFIMQHELYTGIVPMFEKMSEVNLYSVGGNQSYKGMKIPYAQRAVNFIYFKHRFASRQMTALGLFNPWFVAGFPAVVIDRPMDAVNLAISNLPIEEQLRALNLQVTDPAVKTRAALLTHLVPAQYIGMCVTLTHSVDQNGGTTQYVFAQARAHRESPEFLGVDKITLNKKVGESKRSYVVSGLQSPSIGSVGRYGGRVTNVVDVSADKAYKGKILPTLGDKSRVSYKVGETYEGEVAKAYRVTETYDRRKRTNVDFPIEYAIWPPWIWEGWMNLRIGETYEQFFGTGAITDIAGASYQDTASQGSKALPDDFKTTTGPSYDRSGLLSVPYTTTPAAGVQGVPGADIYSRLPEDALYERMTDKELYEPLPKDPSSVNWEAKVTRLATLTLEKERTIENAVDYLVRLYSLVRVNNMDVGQFIRSYSWRPIATLIEILGTSDLVIEEVPPNSGIFKVTSGKEGFHSRAFSDRSNLFGLIDPQVSEVLGIKRSKTGKGGNQANLAVRLDVRASRRRLIREYMFEVGNSKGLLG